MAWTKNGNPASPGTCGRCCGAHVQLAGDPDICDDPGPTGFWGSPPRVFLSFSAQVELASGAGLWDVAGHRKLVFNERDAMTIGPSDPECFTDDNFGIVTNFSSTPQKLNIPPGFTLALDLRPGFSNPHQCVYATPAGGSGVPSLIPGSTIAEQEDHLAQEGWLEVGGGMFPGFSVPSAPPLLLEGATDLGSLLAFAGQTYDSGATFASAVANLGSNVVTFEIDLLSPASIDDPVGGLGTTTPTHLKISGRKSFFCADYPLSLGSDTEFVGNRLTKDLGEREIFLGPFNSWNGGGFPSDCPPCSGGPGAIQPDTLEPTALVGAVGRADPSWNPDNGSYIVHANSAYIHSVREWYTVASGPFGDFPCGKPPGTTFSARAAQAFPIASSVSNLRVTIS